MKAVVMAGGKGTRLAPYTKILPKPLLPIGDMPILEVLIRQLKHSGVDEIFLTVGHLSELLRAFFQGGEQWGVKINYCYEDFPMGTVGALALIPDLTETFLMTNGDVLTDMNPKVLVAHHKRHQAMATIAVHHRKVKIDFGVLQIDRPSGEVKDYIEKPTHEYMVSMGMYVFEPEVVKYVPKGGYLDFPDLILALIAAGEKVIAYPFSGYWQDLGRPDDYEQAAEDFDTLRHQFLPEDQE
jgi:NDP-sugar pyrophosphorylase family protein